MGESIIREFKSSEDYAKKENYSRLDKLIQQRSQLHQMFQFKLLKKKSFSDQQQAESHQKTIHSRKTLVRKCRWDDKDHPKAQSQVLVGNLKDIQKNGHLPSLVSPLTR